MMIRDFKKRLLVSSLLSLPVLALAPMIQQWFGFTLHFPGASHLLFALATVVFGYGGWPFLKGLYEELRQKSPGMMTLIGIAISVAYFYSSAVALGVPGKSFFWELVTLIDIMLLGHWVEMRSILGASRALELLVEMMPAEAHRVGAGGAIEEVKLQDLKQGDIILVRPGEKVPADGIVKEGKSYLNESMLTGESKPVQRQPGQQVIGGSVNGEGSLKVSVEGTGEDSYLSKVIGMVREAQKTKSRTQRLADRAAAILAYVAVSAGAITLFTWLALGAEFAYALERMVTVMVISCPHALGLAVPLVVAISTALAAKSGLLIRNRTAFESSRLISVLVFDKTGTLTEGEFGVVGVEAFRTHTSEDKALSMAAALEQHSEHPIAAAIVRHVAQQNIRAAEIEDFRSITGKGVEARIEGAMVRVVSPGYLRDAGIEVPPDRADAAETRVFVLREDELVAVIRLADRIRPESKDAVAALQKVGIKVMMATGDNQRTADAVSKELGLDGTYAEVLPDEKLRIVKELQERGEYVAMTGDGVNDAPALAQANVGIAVGSGTDVAAETADIILVHSDPRDISSLIMFGRATHRKMIQNLLWATAYNIFAIPLAAGVLFQVGVVLSPAIGAVFMSLSTVIVALNAQLLRGAAPQGHKVSPGGTRTGQANT